MSDHKIIGRLSIWIVNLIVIILALVFTIVYLLIRQGNMVEITDEKEEPIAVCGTEGPMDKAYTNLNISENLFKAKCYGCHRFDRSSTGPELTGVFDRIPDYSWFDHFVRSEDSLLQAKDKYTAKINQDGEFPYTHDFKVNKMELGLLKLFIQINE